MPIVTPRFKPRYCVRSIEGAGTLLLTETVPIVLQGELNELVCPLVDGVRSADKIAAELSDRVSAAEVYYTLNLLEKRGLVEEADGDARLAERAFWQSCEIDPATARERLAANPVRVVALGIDPEELRSAALAAGLCLAEKGAAGHGPKTLLVATDDYRRPELDEIDERARLDGTRWALVRPVGSLPTIGPLFDPARPGCWRCLVARIRMNYVADTLAEERTGVVPVTATAAMPASSTAVSNLAALELAKWIAGEWSSELTEHLVCISMRTLGQSEHRLVPRPQCPRCGEERHRPERARQRQPTPLALRPRPRRELSDGGHRVASAAETLDRYSDLVSPITGVVSRLERVSPPGETPIHAYSASHNWATNPDSVAFIRNSLRTASGGKGTTEEAAKVGAMAEAFERYSGVFRGDEIRRTARMSELDGAIAPNEVMLFSERQLGERAEINARGDSFQMVPEPFDPDLETDWSPLWAPTADEFRWLPTGLLYYTYSKSAPPTTPNRLAFFADSNGCASGASLEEAALQALLELVERDAVATWWYNEARRPTVAIDDLAEPYLDELRVWLDAEGRDLWVLDVTNDVGIPAFAAVSRLREPRANQSENVVIGFGAHLEPRLGIMRAITEVNQFFASLYGLGEDDLGKAFDPGAVEWWNTASTANKPYLQPAEDAAPRRLSEYPVLTSEDLLAEVHTTVEMIEARGLEVLLLDQTRPDVGFPVVKAVAPGLRHFWARLGPGRLYDVPLGLGWLTEPHTEQELNPTPVFF
jgi:ribosomal protein S12 methylthiotransferase accessory factor